MSTSISGVTSYDSATEAAAGADTDDLDREAFLNLLVAQLQNQDPLEPQANAEFVSQLAEFSSLEQLTNVNSGLESLYAAMASMNNASMTQLLGAQVTASGDTVHYEGSGDSTMYYDAASNASSATISITDSDGTVVYTEELGSIDEGEGSYTWNGETTSGGTAEEGDYSFSIEAEDENGNDIEVDTMIKGEIDGMSYDTGSPVPSVDGVDISLSDIIEVHKDSDESEESDAVSDDTESDDSESKDGDGTATPEGTDE